ncbi:MAG: YHS domain-containing protein [Candidatus Omnitrophica bacterium]|nr:YHS domain-containing protein [Candidatus Omnitrophota bacterium]
MFKNTFLVLMIGIIIFSLAGLAFAVMCHGDTGGHQATQAAATQATPQEAVNVGNKMCPVSGEKIDDKMKTTYEYEGKIYNFCCPGCIDEFKKEPQKYITKIKEFNLETYQFGFSPEVIEVKKGDIVKILATSGDVPHGVYIKEYNINVPVKKGQTQRIEFVADKNGEFDILCSVYCGKGHNTMKAKLVVKE